ncbi:hypothetical protein FQA47_023070 [Oryzias melastigma]|uniref:Secreted protein n=1 Tax=Oryzias melastigma TaxID=30732 RepID=A0A834FCF2_ORYME|nr:hypothetical protein FQA47_023070 [Oryzias melastigma]
MQMVGRVCRLSAVVVVTISSLLRQEPCLEAVRDRGGTTPVSPQACQRLRLTVHRIVSTNGLAPFSTPPGLPPPSPPSHLPPPWLCSKVRQVTVSSSVIRCHSSAARARAEGGGRAERQALRRGENAQLGSCHTHNTHTQ